MANQITDNRTQLFVAQTSTPASETWVASGGGGSISEDVDIFIEGTTSVAEQITASRRVMLYDNGSTTDLSNGHVYIWVNCGIVGILDTKAAGGLTVRLTGPSTTDFLDWYVGGSDSWPTSIQGGWTMFVVDTASSPSNTGGTPPALTAIQHIGISAITNGTMTKATDNTWVDAAWFLADGSPGVIVEGRNGGTTDWSISDVNTQLTTSAGMVVPGEGGSWIFNAPIQFGINDTTTHGFSDTNQIILWSNQEFVAEDLYGFSALGNSGGTTNVTFGVKTGTGDDATGAQGIIVSAASDGPRWGMDFDDPDVDGVNFYGSTFIHGGDLQLDDAACSFISCQYIDCSSATVNNSEQLRNSVINANTQDGYAFMITDDFGDIVFCSFEFSDGYGVEITDNTANPQISKGNLFSGFGADDTTDSAVANSSGGSLIIQVTEAGDVPTVNPTNLTSASASVTIQITILDSATDPVVGAQVAVFISATDEEIINSVSNISGQVTGVFDGATPSDVYIRVRKSSPGDTRYVFFSSVGTITSNGLTVSITLIEDNNVGL